MIPQKSDHELSRPETRLANVPLSCWLVAVALGGLLYYFAPLQSAAVGVRTSCFCRGPIGEVFDWYAELWL